MAKEIDPEPEREYELQKAVLAAGGTFVIKDVSNEYKQYRAFSERVGKEYQVTELNECKGKLRLMTWEAMLVERDDTKCKMCAKRTNFVFGKAEETSLCFWFSFEDGVDVLS